MPLTFAGYAVLFLPIKPWRAVTNPIILNVMYGISVVYPTLKTYATQKDVSNRSSSEESFYKENDEPEDKDTGFPSHPHIAKLLVYPGEFISLL